MGNSSKTFFDFGAEYVVIDGFSQLDVVASQLPLGDKKVIFICADSSDVDFLVASLIHKKIPAKAIHHKTYVAKSSK